MQDADLIENVITRLKKLLPNFQLATSYAIDSIVGVSISSRPDLVIHDPISHRTTFVELKSLSAKSNLPYAVIPVLKRVRDANKINNLDILLVTNASVTPSLKQQFIDEHIKLIELNTSSEPTAELVASKIKAELEAPQFVQAQVPPELPIH